jgi:gliding motility-associated-like protein
MRPSLVVAIHLFLGVTTINSLAQVNIFRPEITGQTPSPLTTAVNQPITIQLTNLIVSDADPVPVYPDGFTLEVSSGRDYDVNDNTVVPDRDFTGMLTVPVRVSDGRQTSRAFDLKIQVTGTNNVAPEITGQVELTIPPNESFEIDLSHLYVNDPDDNYPDGFDLDVYDGNNYRRDRNIITPRSNFTGTLTVPVSVNDGKDESDKYDLKILVANPENVPPVITGQGNLVTDEDVPFTLKLTDLKVTDPDNAFPKDFTLGINARSDYTVAGATITPAQNFYGMLTVQVYVSDGQNNSPVYPLQLRVNSVNDAPVITGQIPITTPYNTPVTIAFSHLKVTDPDAAYPSGFSLKVSPGNNYSVAGNSINPTPGFSGQLTVGVVVSDGIAESNSYPLLITVEPKKNIAPVITKQNKELSIDQNASLTISLADLSVTDPDNAYPTDFTLKVSPGNNYAVEETTIKPLPNFTKGILTVNVIVNDGTDDSAPFGLKIEVVPTSTKPKINGQTDVSMLEDASLKVVLDMLKVTDADNPGYPKGFSLTVQPGNKDIYTVSGNTITPAPNLNGFIEVAVKVSDGVNTSDPFNLSIFVEPVNDAPEIVAFDTTYLVCEPGGEPINIFQTLELRDVDNDHLTLAEIGFDSVNYSPANDELLLIDSTNINVIYDPNGTLFLIGYATLDEYQAAIRAIQYNYRMTQDANGDPTEIISGPRNIYITLHDGQLTSSRRERQINMEGEVALDIPNTFTPNGDSSNDTWRIRTTNKSQLDQAVIRVYNKRGLLVYEATGFEKEWDGIAHGQLLPVDTYYYTIDLNLDYMKQTYKGFLTILH